MMETIRAIARDRAAGTREGGKAPGLDSPTAQPTTSTRPRPVEELRRQLRELAQGVNIADAESVRDARTPALREILLWEFGSDFRQDAQFLPMVDAINAALDDNPGFQQQFQDMISELQKD
jgi:hypothetical protein